MIDNSSYFDNPLNFSPLSLSAFSQHFFMLPYMAISNCFIFCLRDGDKKTSDNKRMFEYSSDRNDLQGPLPKKRKKKTK